MNKENSLKYMSSEQWMSAWNEAINKYCASYQCQNKNIQPFKCKTKKEFGYEDLKPGMVLIATNGDYLILFPTKCGIAYMNLYERCYWSDLKDEYADNFGVNPELLVIDSVFDVVYGTHSLTCNEEGDDNNPLWKRQITKPKIEITKEMIAEKFDVDVEQIELV